jgi:hypothetical protein
VLDVQVGGLDYMLERFWTGATLNAVDLVSSRNLVISWSFNDLVVSTYMSELKFGFLKQSAADETPVFPVLGFRFQKGKLVLLTTAIASERRQGSERGDRRQVVRLTKVEEP